ncbi:MAG TPA: sugar phosphate isomerase/epimerase [Victivallales bacterium]|nr:sugar phosphate isomerase/epimerase [Victivallales bacterium]HRR29030.1 sugar phosphate isomerase/epimerase [Victivallales bacterium]HRU00934.1 sugar phosphate isomerase/epimerase [Victivallales bacterium]
MKLKFSAADWAYYEKSGLSPEEYYNKLVELGYTGVEMVPQERLKIAKSAGLEILNESIFADCIPHGLNRKENHPRLIKKIRDSLQIAGEEGIKALIIFSGNRMGQPDCEGMLNCRMAIEKVLPDAEKNKVILLFEVFNIYNHEDYQADNSRYAFSLARSLSSPFFKVLYDIYHMEMMGESSENILPVNIAHVGHLHVADIPYRDIPKLSGGIDYSKIIKSTMKAGYKGFWGMEFHSNNPIKDLADAKKMFESFLM